MRAAPGSTTPIHLATLKGHIRPIECMASIPATTAGSPSTVYTADSMGVIKIWNVRGQAAVLQEGSSGKRVPEISVVPGVGQWERYELVGELRRHETSIAEVLLTSDGLWSGEFLIGHSKAKQQRLSTMPPSSILSRIPRQLRSTTASFIQPTSSRSSPYRPHSTPPHLSC